MLLNCGVGEDSWESFGLQGDPTSPSYRRSDLSIHWKNWCWSWNSNTLATWCEELTHWKRPWCWERLKVGEEGDSSKASNFRHSAFSIVQLSHLYITTKIATAWTRAIKHFFLSRLLPYSFTCIMNSRIPVLFRKVYYCHCPSFGCWDLLLIVTSLMYLSCGVSPGSLYPCNGIWSLEAKVWY